jgi:hypothetical protein
MGDIITFPKSRIVGSKFSSRAPRRKRDQPWRLVHLGGRSPHGHPPLKRGPRGKVLLAKRQVWVMLHNDELWTVFHIEDSRHSGTFPHHVWLRRYRSRGICFIELAEQSLRAGMRVWEDAVEFKKELMVKVKHASETDPTSIFRGLGDGGAAAPRFFGLDDDGNKID